MAGYAGRDAVIVEAVRTPIGKGKASGALHDVLPVDLLAHSLTELVKRTGIDPAQIDDVITGAVSQVGDQAVNIGRNALLAAGFPETVPGTTVDRQCGSSQQAISFAAQGVIAGAYDIVVAAGVESMSRVPMGSSVLPGSDPFGAMAQRYPEGLVPQGISAELIAAKWGFSRQQLDEFSAGSHEKAAQATKEGRFDNELIPIAGLGHRRDHSSRHDGGDAGGSEARVLQPRVRGAVPADQVGDHARQFVAAVGRQRGGADHHE